MSLTLSANTNSDYTPHPQGSFAARCVRIIDLGTQTSEYLGQVTSAKKVMLCFETSELMTQGEFAGKPYMISKRYTASVHEKSTLCKDLQGWRGRPFTDAERKKFELSSVLGVPCMLNVMHSQSKDGTKTFANIAGITQMPRGLAAPDPVADSYVFNLDEPDMAVFDKLSDRLKETIRATPEWLAYTDRASAPAQRMTAKPAPAPVAAEEDDIPF